MENASKALVIAGGVIIAVMILATLLYASKTWNIIPQAEDTTLAQKQLMAFNQQYESYARDALYGVDLISILNKAIDNNEKYNVKPGELMSVNVEFIIKNDIEETTITKKHYTSGNKKGEDIIVSSNSSGVALKKRNSPYSLKNDLSVIKTWIKKAETEIRKSGNQKFGSDDDGKYQEYQVTTAGGSEFKTRIFRCTELGYDSEGRVNYMKFEEQEITNS